MKKVSICIPTYSRLEYLRLLVNSVLCQTYTDFEICISQDVTPNGLVPEIHEYCKRLVKEYPSIIKYEAQSKNMGLAGNWNALLSMAKGEYVFIPGDDDLIAPEFLEKMVNEHTANADVIFCNQQFINSKGNLLIDLTKELNTQYKRDHLDTGWIAEPIRVVLQNSVPMSSSLIKRRWFTDIKFDNSINTPELEVFLKIAVAGGRFYYHIEELAYYRVHETSATSSGLTIGQYLENIIDIQVPECYEMDKINLIKTAIVSGINNAIKKRNPKLARKLYYSRYYDRNSRIIAFTQSLLIHMPNAISRSILNLKK